MDQHPSDALKLCPSCQKSVPAGAIVCPGCRHRFDWDQVGSGTATTKRCPRCREEISADARACRHCGTDFFTLRMRQFGTALILITLAAAIATCVRFS